MICFELFLIRGIFSKEQKDVFKRPFFMQSFLGITNPVCFSCWSKHTGLTDKLHPASYGSALAYDAREFPWEYHFKR